MKDYGEEKAKRELEELLQIIPVKTKNQEFINDVNENILNHEYRLALEKVKRFLDEKEKEKKEKKPAKIEELDPDEIITETKKEIEESLYEILAHFKDELKPDKLSVQDDLALISTVGKNMTDKPGTSGKLFGALGKNNINIVMIAQGSDEINITVGVKKKDFTKTVQVIYDTFVGGNE